MQSEIHYGMDSGSRKFECGIQRPGSRIDDLHGFSYIGRELGINNMVWGLNLYKPRICLNILHTEPN